MALVFPSSPTTGQIFAPGAGLPTWMWDGTKWTNATTPPLHLAALSDVALSSLASGEPLIYNGTNWVNNPNLRLNSDNSGTLGPNSTNNLNWNTAGNFTINQPSSGNPLTVTAASAAAVFIGETSSGNAINMAINDSGNAFVSFVPGGASQITGVLIGTGAAIPVAFYTNAAQRLVVGPNGNVSVNQPAAGNTALTVLGRFTPTSVAAFQAVGGSNNPGLYVNMTDSPSKVSLIASGTNIPTNIEIAFANGPVLNFGGVNTATFSATYVQAPNMASTGVTGLPYVVMDGNGNLLKWGATSSLRYKTNIHSVVREQARAVLSKLRAITYTSTIEGDDPERVSYGLIAEEVAAVDSRLVHFKDGKPESVIYERVAMLLLPLMQEILGMDEPEGEVYG